MSDRGRDGRFEPKARCTHPPMGNRPVVPTLRRPDVAGRHLHSMLLQLHAMAVRCLRQERGVFAPHPAALVNEAYLRLSAQRIDWGNHARVLAVASRMMRRVLIDRARRRRAVRRDGVLVALTPRDVDAGFRAADPTGMIDLERALRELGDQSARRARIVELRYFAGYSIKEAARALGISTATVKREWRLARTWLFARLR